MRGIFLLALAVLFLPQVAAERVGVEVTKVSWGDLSDPISIYPGDENVPLLIELTNTENRNIGTIKATLYFQKPFFFKYYETPNMLVKTTKPISITLKGIKVNQSTTLRYYLDIDSTAKPGTYKMELKLVYVDDPISGETFPLFVSVGENSELTVKQVTIEPAYPIPGNIINIKLSLSNTGTRILKDIHAKLDLDSVSTYGKEEGTPFAPLASEPSEYVANLDSKAEKDITFTIISDGSAKPQPYSLRLYLEYRDASGNKRNVTKSIGIPLYSKGDFEIQSLEITPVVSYSKGIPEVTTGKITLKFDVINTGTAPADLVMIKLEDAPFLRPERTSAYIGPLDPDDFGTVKFDAWITGDAGEYKIPLKISYYDSYNQKHTVGKEIPIRVGGGGVYKGTEEGKENIFIRFIRWLFGL